MFFWTPSNDTLHRTKAKSMSRKYEIGTSRCHRKWLKNIRQLKNTIVFDEVNLWSSNNRDSALEEGTLFLFRSKPDPSSNEEYIVGGGRFYQAEKDMTYSEAWKYYREANGVMSEKEFHEIAEDEDGNKPIASNIIRSPFFLDKDEWIDYYKVISKEVPEKTPQEPLEYFEFGEEDTKNIWENIKEKFATIDAYKYILENAKSPGDLVGKETRPGQATFRKEVLKLFEDKCAVTGINATDIIEAAHIKPYSIVHEHKASNGISLRADLHKLLDSGYATIRKNGEEFQFIISDKFWKNHNDSSEMYRECHEAKIKMPSGWRIDEESLEWHHNKHKDLLGDVIR